MTPAQVTRRARQRPQERPERRHWTMMAIAIALLAGAAQAREGQETVIVLSSNAAPYRQAEAGLRKQMTEEAMHLRTIELQELKEKGIEAGLKTPDLVIAIGTPAAQALHRELPAATPLTYCMVSDPEGAGLTEGRDTQGVSVEVPLDRQFALLAEALPKVRTLGMLYRSDTADGQRRRKRVQEALPAGWNLEAVAVDQHASTAAAIETLTQRQIDAIWTAPDSSVYDSVGIRALLLASLRKGIPVFGFSTAFVRAGALLGVSVDPQAQGQQAARLGLRLLKKPAGRVETKINPAEDYQTAVNLIVAEKLGIELPPDLVARAGQVFKEDR